MATQSPDKGGNGEATLPHFKLDRGKYPWERARNMPDVVSKTALANNIIIRVHQTHSAFLQEAVDPCTSAAGKGLLTFYGHTYA